MSQIINVGLSIAILAISSTACKQSKTETEIENQASKEIAEEKNEYREDVNEEVSDANTEIYQEKKEMGNELVELRQEYQDDLMDIRQDAKEEKKELFLTKLEKRKAQLEEQIASVENRLEKDYKDGLSEQQFKDSLDLASARARLEKSLELVDKMPAEKWSAMRESIVDSFEGAFKSLENLDVKESH